MLFLIGRRPRPALRFLFSSDFRPAAAAFSGLARAGVGREFLVGTCLVLLVFSVGCGGGGGGESGSDRPKAEGRAGAGEGDSGGDKGESERGGEARSERGGERGERGSRRGGSRGGPPGGFPGADADDGRGVPVEIVRVGRRPISLYFETNGTLEAENEVDLVARTSGPITRMSTEEGRQVRKGQLLAVLDDREIRAQLEAASVRLEETRQSFERVRTLHEKELLSRDTFDQAAAAFETAQADHDRLEIQLQYTRIEAPFSGLVVARYVKFAEFVQNGARLFRLSDFDPLLVRIQVPERELSRLRTGQSAEIRVEAFAERRFAAELLRISPVVDAETGTVRVTLEVQGEGSLRPGMFARVFLEMESRPDALVVPKNALALDSLGNTVYVAADDGTAERRDLELGFRNEQLLEVLSGVEAGESVVVVGQDGLSDGTPIEILGEQDLDGVRVSADDTADTGGAASASTIGGDTNAERRAGPRGRGGLGGGSAGGFAGGPRGERPDLSDPEQVERVKAFLRDRGLSDEQIEQRLERMRARQEEGGARGRGGDRDRGSRDGGAGGGEVGGQDS